MAWEIIIRRRRRKLKKDKRVTSEFSIGTGDDKINSGKGDDTNYGDTSRGDGSGDDKINNGEGRDVILEIPAEKEQVLEMIR